MTREPQFIDLLEGYLDDFEGPTPLPDVTRDAVRAQLPSTHQRPAWWPGWRFPEMNNSVRIAIAGVAVMVVALLGVQLFAPGAGVGEPTTATPDPTPAASTETATVVIGEGFLSHARVTTSVPDGWDLDANFANKDGRIGFSAWTTPGVYDDPCSWADEDMDFSATPTAEEILAALIAQPGRDPSTPTETTLGGWPAMRVELRVPDTLDISTCDQGRYKAWTDLSDPPGGNWNHESGQFDVIHVVDVDGGPVVIDNWYHESTSGPDLGELEGVLEAMVIDFQD